jgi:hypothetical protein
VLSTLPGLKPRPRPTNTFSMFAVVGSRIVFVGAENSPELYRDLVFTTILSNGTIFPVRH